MKRLNSLTLNDVSHSKQKGERTTQVCRKWGENCKLFRSRLSAPPSSFPCDGPPQRPTRESQSKSRNHTPQPQGDIMNFSPDLHENVTRLEKNPVSVLTEFSPNKSPSLTYSPTAAASLHFCPNYCCY